MSVNTTDLANELRGKITKSRLIDIQPQSGLMPGFVLIFENENEQRFSLGFSAGLSINAQANSAQITALINVNLSEPQS